MEKGRIMPSALELVGVCIVHYSSIAVYKKQEELRIIQYGNIMKNKIFLFLGFYSHTISITVVESGNYKIATA